MAPAPSPRLDGFWSGAQMGSHSSLSQSCHTGVTINRYLGPDLDCISSSRRLKFKCDERQYLTIHDLSTEESDLEDLFLHITGGGGF